MAKFKIMLVCSVVVLYASISLSEKVSKRSPQEDVDKIIDTILQFGAGNSTYNATSIDDMELLYEGVRNNEFGKGAGYDFRNGTVAGITDPIGHRLKPSEFRQGEGRDRTLYIEATIRYPRLVITYNDVRNLGIAPKAKRLVVEFKGIRTKIRIFSVHADFKSKGLSSVDVIFAENSSIRLGKVNISEVKFYRLELMLRETLKNRLSKALYDYYRRVINE